MQKNAADENVVQVADNDAIEAQSLKGDVLTAPKPYKIGPITIPSYHSTYFQVFLTGAVNFLSIGMYNVLTSLGGAGQVEPTIADNANTILYCLFAFVGLFSGSLVNYFGVRTMLSMGAVGLAIYSGSFWSYNNNQNGGFVLFGGAMGGIGAALLWTACGTLVMSYPTEREKGRFVSAFFALSFLGAVIGGIIPVAENFKNKNAGSVSNGTYAAITVLMVISSGVSLLVINPSKVVRSDGTRVYVPRDVKLTLMEEIKSIYVTIKREKWIIWFMPFSFSALFYAAYQTNDFNSYYFNVRTRSVNGLLYGVSQLIAAVGIGMFLDISSIPRRRRAAIGWAVLFLVIFVVSLLGYFPMKDSRRDLPWDPPIDLTDGSKAAAYMTLYFFYGFQDGLSQGYAFWIMGTLSNDPQVLSMYSALFKVFGAIASAIAYAIDAKGVPFVNMYASYWSVSLVGCICLIPLVFLRISDSTEEEPESEQ